MLCGSIFAIYIAFVYKYLDDVRYYFQSNANVSRLRFYDTNCSGISKSREKVGTHSIILGRSFPG